MSSIWEEREQIAKMVENYVPTWMWQAGLGDEAPAMMRPLANRIRRRTCVDLGHRRDFSKEAPTCLNCGEEINFPTSKEMTA